MTKVTCHARTLLLSPRGAEQDFWQQYELLDLYNCLIAPLFFANALSLFSARLLCSIYCAVLAIKGYQLGLLLLPAARQQQAHKRARYWLLLGERVLRQIIATPLLGRGPRFAAWLTAAEQTSTQLHFCCKTLVLLSGFTISCWNAFCLPLDFPAQVVLTSIFFVIQFQSTVEVTKCCA
ncbi:hypothetical protein OEZ86_005266 [Tetradesmus obliquus]|nr:hypothetical protein OEZ86_005266 [Tetradesmus obliquus]